MAEKAQDLTTKLKLFRRPCTTLLVWGSWFCCGRVKTSEVRGNFVICHEPLAELSAAKIRN